MLIMATGDLKNNLRILNSELRKLNVPSDICNLAGLSSGNTDAFLDIFDNILQWHSPALSRLINSKGLKPPSKQENRTKFLEGVYLIFREIFNWKPPLTVAQFISNGFHERKVIMCAEVIRLFSQKIQELEPKAKKQQIADTGHSGLKLILKQPKKGITAYPLKEKGITAHPLKEKDMNVASVLEECGIQCGLLKGGSCICKSSLSEKYSSETASLFSGNSLASDCRGNRKTEHVGNVDDRILAELVEFKAIVLNKFESLESRLSAAEKRIGTVENVLDSLKCASNVNNIPPSVEL